MKKKVIKKSKVKLLPAPKGSDVGKRSIMKLPKGAHVEIEPTALIMQAVTHGASIDMVERLMNMREKIKKEQAEKEYRAAMAKFQAECPIIIKGTSVLNKDGSVRYKYAQIDKILKEVKSALENNNFSYQIKSELIEKPFEGYKAIVFAHHIGGHFEQSEFSSPYEKFMVENNYMSLQQAYLAAKSFSQRVAFCDVFGIMTGEADVDGNKITDPKGKKEKSDKTTTEEATKKIIALPDYIKEGFKLLGYTKANLIYDFCSKFEWNHAKIKKEIEKIISANEILK
jgi:hypothetical protein